MSTDTTEAPRPRAFNAFELVKYDSSATMTDNEEQFTRYSRLLRLLTLRNDANKA